MTDTNTPQGALISLPPASVFIDSDGDAHGKFIAVGDHYSAAEVHAILADRARQAPAPVEVSRLAERPDDMLTVAHIETDGGVATLILGGDQLGDFIDMVGEDEETYTVRIAGMTRAEFEALGEFDGF